MNGLSKFSFLIALIGLTSCSFFSGKQDGLKPIARVFDQYLYAEDLSSLIPPGTSPADSTLMVQNFVDNWIKQQVILAQAEQNLTDEQKNFDLQVQNYKNSLMIYAYEKNLVDQKLDTSFTDSEIKDYYDSNSTSLKLNDYLYKLYYIKVDAGKQINSTIQKLLKSGSNTDMDELKGICISNASDYSFNDEVWVSGADLSVKIPMSSAYKSNIAQKGHITTLSSNRIEYYIYTLNSYAPGQVPPMEVVVDEIKQRILNKRKVNLIEQMRTDLLNDALNKANAETF